MPSPLPCNWSGVFPAATTQFDADLVDLGYPSRAGRPGARRGPRPGRPGHLSARTTRSRRTRSARCCKPPSRPSADVPIIVGVSEFTTARAVAYARDAERIGVDGLMVLPAMVYVPTEDELVAHFRAVAEASALAHHALQQPARLPRQHRLDSVLERSWRGTCPTSWR